MVALDCQQKTYPPADVGTPFDTIDPDKISDLPNPPPNIPAGALLDPPPESEPGPDGEPKKPHNCFGYALYGHCGEWIDIYWIDEFCEDPWSEGSLVDKLPPDAVPTEPGEGEFGPWSPAPEDGPLDGNSHYVKFVVDCCVAYMNETRPSEARATQTIKYATPHAFVRWPGDSCWEGKDGLGTVNQGICDCEEYAEKMYGPFGMPKPWDVVDSPTGEVYIKLECERIFDVYCRTFTPPTDPPGRK